jgi:hypothetical protein
MQPFARLSHVWLISTDDQDQPVIPACILAFMMICVVETLGGRYVVRSWIVAQCHSATAPAPKLCGCRHSWPRLDS